MNLLSDDLLIYISKFLDNNTCCSPSDVHQLSLTNKYYFNIYKEKINFLPLVPSDYQHHIYKKIVKSIHSNCYLCGPFNKIEIRNIIDAIKTAVCVRADFSRERSFYPHGLSNTIHFDTIYEMDILKTKTNCLTNNLTFLIAGRCCTGKGSTLYIKQ